MGIIPNKMLELKGQNLVSIAAGNFAWKVNLFLFHIENNHWTLDILA